MAVWMSCGPFARNDVPAVLAQSSQRQAPPTVSMRADCAAPVASAAEVFASRRSRTVAASCTAHASRRGICLPMRATNSSRVTAATLDGVRSQRLGGGRWPPEW